MAIDWHTREFASAAELRASADREERLAAAASADGDDAHAAHHKKQAAEYRELARLKEIA